MRYAQATKEDQAIFLRSLHRHEGAPAGHGALAMAIDGRRDAQIMDTAERAKATKFGVGSYNGDQFKGGA